MIWSVSVTVTQLDEWTVRAEHVGEINYLNKQIDLLMRRQKVPRSRVVLIVPCVSIWLRNRFWPHFRWRKKDGSMVEFGMLGLVVLMSLPKWRKVVYVHAK